MRNSGRPVALGFEAPLFVPVPISSPAFGRARDGECNRAWSAGAGSCVLTTGLAQTAWVLRNLREGCPTQALSATWNDFSTAGKGLLIWEAFVSGNSKPASEAEASQKAAAAAAVTAFRDSLPNPPASSVITTSDPFSLVDAAAIWSGWVSDPSFLHEASVAIAPESPAVN